MIGSFGATTRTPVPLVSELCLVLRSMQDQRPVTNLELGTCRIPGPTETLLACNPSPAPDKDRKGATASINSYCKVNLGLAPNGVLSHNIWHTMEPSN